MKRNVVVIVFLSLILVLSLTVVSAGSFGSFWNKITGKAISSTNSNLPDLVVSKLNVYRENETLVTIDYCISVNNFVPNISDPRVFYLKSANLNNPSWDFGGEGYNLNFFSERAEQCNKATRSGVGAAGGNGFVLGNNIIKLIIDSNNNIIESNESNNINEFNFYIGENCTDSDGGYNLYEKGKLVWRIDSGEFLLNEDSCAGNYLTEYDCKGGKSISEVYLCENGCKDGSCVKEPECLNDFACSGGEKCVSGKCIIFNCTDTDGGVNYYKVGSVTNPPPDYTGFWTDECITDTTLQEGSCDPNLGVYIYDCPYGCKDGVCVSGESSICGNGIIEKGEVCDDGNIEGGDSCSGDCQQVLDKNFCFKKNFTAVFVLAIIDDVNVSINMKKLEDIKPELIKSFSKATDGLATLEIPDNIIVLNYSDYVFNRKYNNMDEIFPFLKNEFYGNYEDKYDFIFVFPNYINYEGNKCQGPGLGGGSYVSVQNRIFNIGQNVFDTTKEWGFGDNLKGFTQVNSIMCAPEKFDYVKTGIRVLLHEMGHEWGVYVTSSIDKDNEGNTIGPHKYNESNIYSGYGDLGLLTVDLNHWNGFFIAGPDPLGGMDWKQEGDVFYYTDSLEVTDHRYNPLMLYFMGLLKKEDLINKKFYILEPTEFVPNFKNFSQAFRGNLREFDIQNIINLEGGEPSCFNVTDTKITLSGENENITCENGCILEGKCYPFGYRKLGQYCSDSYKFVEQAESEVVCDNNFECKSNVCVNNQCINQGLLQKILDWFKNIF